MTWKLLLHPLKSEKSALNIEVLGMAIFVKDWLFIVVWTMPRTCQSVVMCCFETLGSSCFLFILSIFSLSNFNKCANKKKKQTKSLDEIFLFLNMIFRYHYYCYWYAHGYCFRTLDNVLGQLSYNVWHKYFEVVYHSSTN